MAEVDAAGRRVMLERLQQMGLVSKGASMDALIDARVGARQRKQRNPSQLQWVC